ncbi:MAG: 50S ribosomal protein L20 [Microgenomates group bacterium ADurb.Bin219]|nr:MAG: 50S ribosomal protein L20 [Microgenomates group bacterium ADurb.Bin219]HNP89656.1 50S ribosomal protein L20 [Candidatus Woesebacteria bacterium]
MRVKTGVARRQHHKKILDLNKGFRMTKNRLFQVANEAALHAGQYAYDGRKNKKRDFRRLWIIRINGALSQSEISYSRFITLLKKAKVELDRKILAIIAAEDPQTFQKIVKEIK